jgi:hypothetical protein
MKKHMDALHILTQMNIPQILLGLEQMNQKTVRWTLVLVKDIIESYQRMNASVTLAL